MKNKVIIYGAGGHAECLIDIIEKQGEFIIAGLIDDKTPRDSSLLDYAVLGDQSALSKLHKAGITKAFVAIGDNRIRKAKTTLLLKTGFDMITAIHPFSSIGRNTSLGLGTCIFHGAVIDPCVRIGPGVIINKRAVVGHDAVIDDFVHIAPGVNCGAGVRIGKNCLVGIGATVIPHLTIGHDAIIGAGSVVIRDVPPHTTVVGVPARTLPGK